MIEGPPQYPDRACSPFSSLAIVGAHLLPSRCGNSSYSPGRRGRGGRRRPGAGAGGAAANVADVPVYLDGVGTTKALNTVTVSPQVDGKLIKIAFKEGQDVTQGYVLAEIDPDDLSGAIRPGGGEKSARRSATRQCETRSRALHAARRDECRDAPAARHAKALVAAARSASQTSIRRRSTTRPQLSATPRSSRRSPAAPASAKSTKAISCVRSNTTAIVIITQIKPLSMLFSLPQQDLARMNKAFSAGPLAVEVLGADNTTVADKGNVAGRRQSGRSDDGHGEAEGRISQRANCSCGPGNSSMSGS